MQNTKITKYLNWVLKGVLYLVLITPLLVNSRFVFPFITSKTLFFRLIIELAIILYAALAMMAPKFRPKMTKLSWLIVIFGGIILLTGITGVDFYKSFWGTIERGEGFLTISHLIIYFLILSWTFKSKQEIINYITGAVIIGLFVDLYAILQRAQVENFFLFGRIIHSGEGRLSSTIGNAAFLGAFTLSQFFLSLLLFLKRKQLFWKIIMALAVIINLYVLYQTQTRGSAIGLAVVAFLTSIFYFFKSPDKIKKIIAATILLIIIISSSLIWIKKDSSLVQSSKMLRRLVNISATDVTTESRIAAWKTSWNGWKDRFVFGYGWENYNVAFNKYFPAIIFRDAGSQLWFDRAHNTIFDVAVATGIIGLICYLSIFGLALYYLYKNIKYDFDFSAILMALLIAHFVQNIFVFDVLSTYIILFLVFASVVINNIKNNTQETGQQKSEFNIFIFSIVFILIIFCSYFFNFKPAKANMTAIKALISARMDQENKSVEIFQKAINMNTYQSPELRKKLGDNILTYNKTNSKLSATDVKNNFEICIQELKNNINEHPNDAQDYMYLAAIYNRAAIYNANYLDNVIETSKQALKLSPTRPQIYFEMGQAEANRKNFDKAIEYFKLGIELNPKTVESHWNLMTAYILSGQTENAEKEKEFIKSRGQDFDDINNLNRLYSIYLSVGNKNKLVEILEKVVIIQPSGLSYARLATVYKEVGKYAKALEAVKKAVELDPSLTNEANKFIELLK